METVSYSRMHYSHNSILNSESTNGYYIDNESMSTHNDTTHSVSVT